MIAIIDYQMGNLRSVQKALERVGADAVITDDPSRIRSADRVILPGVGAFGDAMVALEARDLVPVIREVINAGTPFLGICLGLQLLFDHSEEGGGGDQRGLGVIPGAVRRFDRDKMDGLKIPHMGWNQLTIDRPAPIFAGVPNGSHFYFVHSYYVAPRDPSVIATRTNYGGEFCSAIWRDNIFATQFHPEKSQRFGLELLKNFAEV